MNVSLPDEMKAFIDEEVAAHGYGTSSEYVRDLVRKEQDRQRLRTLVLQGGASPTTGVADAAYFDALRARASAPAAGRAATHDKSTAAGSKRALRG